MEKNSIRCSFKKQNSKFLPFLISSLLLPKSKTRVLQSLLHTYLVFIKAQGRSIYELGTYKASASNLNFLVVISYPSAL